MSKKRCGCLRDLILLLAAAVIIILSIISAVALARHVRSTAELPVIQSSDSDYDPREQYTAQSVDELLLNEAQTIVSTMSNETKAGQLLLIRSNGADLEQFAALAAECHVGGVVLFGEDTSGQTAETMKQYTAALQSTTDGHLLICVDEEGGDVVRLSSNENLRSSRFKSPQRLFALGGMDAIREDTAEKSSFLKSFGINVNFAPVADVVTSPFGFLYSRSFGQGGEATAEYVYAVVSVMKESGIGSTVKHFPGYGNSSGDTHEGLVVIDTSEEDIRQRELLPFAAGIAAGADSVMVTHTIISAIDPNAPATLSPTVISLLRDELGFNGVIISDAMDMGAIAEYTGGQDACVSGFLAGLDMLCTPSDARASYAALLSAVENGTISQERLDASVTRIVMWKLSLGLYEISG